jgi:hypothetical protein
VLLAVPEARRAVGTVPAVIVLAFNAVIGIVMLAEPLKLVAVPVAPPEVAMVLAVCRVVAVVALPDKAPEKVPATKVFVLGLYVNVAVLSCNKP